MKWFMLAIGILSIGATVAMYFIGSNSSHLSELLRYVYYPLPLAAIGLGSFFRMGKKNITK